jgi:3',5'-cyclic AMP phosphodiesterase CpdA
VTLLATFVQISDLHIGLPDSKGDSWTAPDVKKLACTFQVWQGSLGHQLRSLRYLQLYLNEQFRDKGVPFELIVTGDYTRCGHSDELELAYRYLTASVRLPPPPSRSLPTGLRLSSLPLGVGGNHDHWGGYNSPASTNRTDFHRSPLEPASGFPYVINSGRIILGRELVFVGVNSDADVLEGSIERLLAHGEFTTQIDALRRIGTLSSNPTNELRVLVIHHARHATGALRMTSQSRAELDTFLKSADISVILSGHTHVAYTQPVLGVPELCSASTTQIDEAPAGWTNILNKPPTVAFNRNGFLVHRLHDDGGALRWDVHGMVRGPQGNGFEEAFCHAVPV